MLRQRVITALLLAPLVVACILWLPTEGFAAALALVLLLAANEWARLAGLHGTGHYGLFVAALVLAVLGVAGLLWTRLPPWPLLAPALAWWIWVAYRVLRTTAIATAEGPDKRVSMAGLAVLVPCWAGLVWLHQQPDGPLHVLFLMTLIWVADSAAYFTGKRWGKTRLQPVVSPGKTLEGVAGALLGAALWSAVPLLAIGIDDISAPLFLLLCLFTVLASIVGDLYESLLKRSRGLKDSGALLPGHGGVLDRIDSLTAAAPVFAFGLYLLGAGK